MQYKWPNLIAHDLVIVHPMASMSGYITYVKYTAGSNKGNTVQGDVFNDPFRLGKVDPNYTASTVVKDYAVATGTTFQNERLDWTPVVPGTVVVTSGTDKYYDDGKGNLIKNPTSVTRMPIVNQTNASGHLEGTPGRASVIIEGGTNGGVVIYGANDTTTDRPNPGVYLTTAIQGGEGVSVNVSYVY